MIKKVKLPGSKPAKKIKYKKIKQRKPLGERILRILCIIFAVTLGISYASLFIDPDTFRMPLLFGLYFVPIVIINVLLLLLSLFFHKESFLIPVIALLPSLFIADRFVKIGDEDNRPQGENIRILSYNVGRFKAAGRKVSQDEAFKGIRAFIKEQKPDIVCLQEVMLADTSRLEGFLPGYPYSSHYFFKGKQYFGNVTFSRYPISAEEVIKFKGSTNLSLSTDIASPTGNLRVLNCHLESNSISFSSVIQKLRQKDLFKQELTEVHEKLQNATMRRTGQVSTVITRCEESDCPFIVCGDFNETPVSYTYQRFQKIGKDSFVESGSGFSSTFATLWPLLRIDYIFIPQYFTSEGHTTHRVPYSDHYPISTTIYLQQ